MMLLLLLLLLLLLGGKEVMTVFLRVFRPWSSPTCALCLMTRM